MRVNDGETLPPDEADQLPEHDGVVQEGDALPETMDAHRSDTEFADARRSLRVADDQVSNRSGSIPIADRRCCPPNRPRSG